MQPFWRTEPLSADETELYRLTLDAHAKSVLRDNISSNVVLNVAMGSGQIANAVAAAIMSIGGVHAPLAATISALTTDASVEAWQAAIADGMRVPGWGNSFCKVDALWTEVEEFQRANWPSLWKRADRLTALLHEAGRDVYPNPSLYTAVTALALGVPAAAAPLIFIEGRMWAWAALALREEAKA